MTRSHLENDGYNLKSSFEKSESENKVQGVLTIKFDSPCTERERERKKKLMRFPENERDLIVVGYGDKEEGVGEE